jgi:hypothetical protein
MRFTWTVALASVIVMACGPTSNPAASTPSAVASRPSAVPAASPNPNIADAVVREAAAYAAVPPPDVRVVQLEAREWPDSSLGCPRPGLMYSQVVTPGYLIVVQAGTRTLEYHSDARGRVVLCKEL